MTRTQRQAIPRARGRPLLGSLIDFWRHPVGLMADAYLELGSVFRLDLGGSESVVIGGEAARDFLAAEERKPAAARCPMSRLGLFRPFAREVGLPVFDTDGETHARLRQLIQMPYSRQVTAQFVPEMDRVVADVVESWLPGQSFDLLAVCCRLAQHAMMEVITPVSLRADSDAVTRAGNRVMYTQFRLLPEVALKTPRYRRARDAMRAGIDQAIERHMAGEFASEPRTYLIDACLQARDGQGGRMDPDTIRGVCFYALAGGEIYMGRLVCFLVYELLKNRTLLDRVLGEIDSTPRGGDLSAAFRRMPHLRASYLETLRCYPLIPGYSYDATGPVEVGGRTVPAGARLTFAPFLAHHDPNHYPNPTSFDPARHDPVRRGGKRMFVPFGVGAHACAAPGMAEVVVLTLAVALLRRVELRLARPVWPLELRLQPLIAPASPLRVRVVGPRRPGQPGSDRSRLAERADFGGADDAPDWTEALPEKLPVAVPAGTRLIEEGTEADAFYVVLEGRLSVQRAGPGGPEHLAHKGPGSCVGETGLLKGAPRNATVVADDDVTVYRFAADEFLALIRRHDLTADDLRSLYYGRFIAALLRASLGDLSAAIPPDSVDWRSLAPGACMFRQGEPSDAFYVIVEGTVDVLTETDGASSKVASLGPGAFFGEIGVLNAQPRGATIQATSALKTLRVERGAFLDTLREHPEALSDLALITCQRLVAKAQASATP